MASAAKIVFILAIIITCFVAYPYMNPQDISAFISRNNVSAPALFIAICAVRPLLFFLPSMGLTIVAGVLFGSVLGTVYVAIGGILSTAVGYYFARWFGREAAKIIVARHETFREWEARAQSNSMSIVLSMRLFNLPWDIVSYWAGLQGIRFRDFYIASMIPLIPISFLYTYFGSNVFEPRSAGFIISLATMFALGSIPYIRARWNRKRRD